MNFQIKESEGQTSSTATAEKLFASDSGPQNPPPASQGMSFWMCLWLVLFPLQGSGRTSCYEQGSPETGASAHHSPPPWRWAPRRKVPRCVSCDSASQPKAATCRQARGEPEAHENAPSRKGTLDSDAGPTQSPGLMGDHRQMA